VGKAPAFLTYEKFLEFCVANRKWALNFIARTGPYTPFIFGDFSIENGVITFCAGYRVIADLTKLLRPRVTSEYKSWRKSVLNKSGYKCDGCGTRKNLHVHHIEPVKNVPRKIVDVNNGITLCARCHRDWHKKIRMSNV